MLSTTVTPTAPHVKISPARSAIRRLPPMRHFTRVKVYQCPFERGLYSVKIVDPLAVGYESDWHDHVNVIDAYNAAMLDAGLIDVSDDCRVEILGDWCCQTIERTIRLSTGDYDSIEALLSAEIK